jgi:4-hydroxythreonine-4-phosphate dehydrogenase
MKNPEELPLIGIPLGDPAGIGPEIVVKALSEPQINAVSRPVIFGDCKLLQQTANALATDLHFFPAAAGQ